MSMVKFCYAMTSVGGICDEYSEYSPLSKLNRFEVSGSLL